MSPQTQNELIELMWKHIILWRIVDEVNASPFYSILADEVNSQHLTICIIFLDHKQDIREEFVTFLSLEWITGRKISESVLAFLKGNNIPNSNMRDQGYDGASN